MIDIKDLITSTEEEVNFALRYASMPTSIKDAISDAVTMFSLKHDLTDEKNIELFSELADDVAFSIQIAMIENKKQIENSKNE